MANISPTNFTIGAIYHVRHSTNDYLYGALMGLSIIVMLLIPIFKKRLTEETIEGEVPKAK